MQSNIIAAEKIMNAEADAPSEGSMIDREATVVAQTTSGSVAYATKADALKNNLAENGPVIDVLISLAAGIELPSDQRIFVAVRNSAKQGIPPLAAMDLRVADLPARITLDNSSAVGPFNLSSAEEVYVSALASAQGVASPQPGDYRVLSNSFAHNNQHMQVELKLSEKVR